ncbi:hypothetical protein CHS0354_028722, partial [Potamilus streckersoni]
AASFFCRYLPVERLSDTGRSEISCFEPGKRYLVLDAGGGTVDITVHEVLHSGNLRELYKANGGPWGGTTVDESFKDFLKILCGQQTFARFESEFKDAYLDLLREFEAKKRTVCPELDQKVTLKIPIAIHEAFQNDHGQSFREAVAERQDLQGKLVFAGDKMRVEPSLMKSFFQRTCDTIVGHLKDLFDRPELSGVTTILMVGGFSESPMLRHAIQVKFPQMRIVVPHEAGLAVLKGAVIFGHQPKIISSRVSRYTYGISVRELAQPSDPEEKLIKGPDGIWLCRGHFSKFVEIGQEIPVGARSMGSVYNPIDRQKGGMKIKVFVSTERNPKFVEEKGCTKLGEIYVERGRRKGVEVTMIFGGTELGVEAIDLDTGKLTNAKFDFLE